MATDPRVLNAVRNYYQLVYRVLRRSGVQSAELEDLCQEVFWVFSRKLALIELSKERSFLIGTALRMAADRRKAYRRRPQFEPEAQLSSLPAEHPDAQLERKQALARLDAFLASLPEAQSEVFLLIQLEQMTAPEVSEMLGIPLGTVASRLRLAREAFHARFASRHSDVSAQGSSASKLTDEPRRQQGDAPSYTSAPARPHNEAAEPAALDHPKLYPNLGRTL